MAKKDRLLMTLEKAYESEKAKEVEELHNAIVGVLNEHKASIYNSLFVLDLVRFELMQAKYKEILGVVKLTEKPPIGKIEKKK